MERAFPLKSQDQPTRIGHFCRIIFDDFPGLYCIQYLLRGDAAFKHTLDGMHAKNGFGFVHS